MLYIKHTEDVLNDLKERYLQGDKICVTALYQDVSKFKQGELKVSKNFTEMHALWEELD